MLHPALVTAALLAATTAAPATAPGGGGSPGPGAAPARDHLVITVTDAGPDADGTYELFCDPAEGRHPEPVRACATLREADRPFAPVSEGAVCTRIYGGPASAEVEGVWEGEPVRATFSRADGCEIARWDALVPALPRAAGANRP